MNDVFIVQTASFLPNAPVANEDMERILGQTGERPSRAKRLILRSNGIRNRHYAIDVETGEMTHTNAQLTAQAVRNVMDRAELDHVPCLSCGTSLPDHLFPNHALMVQGELGLSHCEAVATSGVCLSGLSALKYAAMTVAAGQHDRAVAAGSELVSSHLLADRYRGPDDEDMARLEKAPEVAFEQEFLRWMLSDGAGAMLLRSTPRLTEMSLRIDWIDLFSYAGEMPPCMYAGASKSDEGRLRPWASMDHEDRARLGTMSIKQDVKLLNETVIDYTLERPLAETIAKRNLSVSEIDYFLPHYSSAFFKDRVADGLKRVEFDIPQDRWFTNLTRKGNTGAASIYIILDELFHGHHLELGQKLLCWVPESGRFSSGFMHLTVV